MNLIQSFKFIYRNTCSSCASNIVSLQVWCLISHPLPWWLSPATSSSTCKYFHFALLSYSLCQNLSNTMKKMNLSINQLEIVCYFANICISNFFLKKKKIKIHTAVSPVSLAEFYSFWGQKRQRSCWPRIKVNQRSCGYINLHITLQSRRRNLFFKNITFTKFEFLNK